MKPGWSIASRPPQGTFDGAPNIHTPSWAEHGPEGVLFLSPTYMANESYLLKEDR